MKNLFNKNHLKKIVLDFKKKGVSRDLAERIYTSRLLGSNPSLVLHGGGNTSVKSQIKDIDNIIHDIIYVKGSGSDLGNINQNGFPAVKLNPLLKIMEKKFITDEQMVQYLRKNLIDISSPNPSVETLVHAIIKEKFVDHTHSNAILKITDRPDGLKILNKLFGKNFIIIPYVMPGYLLSKKVSELYKQDKNCNGLILFKHGIFTFADTAKDSYDHMIDAINIAEEYLKKEKIKKIIKIKNKKIELDFKDIAAILRGELCKKQDYILNFRTNKKLISIINSKNIREYLGKGVVTPDHVIRTKPTPLILNIDNCKNSNDLKSYIKKEIFNFKKNYENYFNKFNKGKNLYKILDTVPQIILVQNLGMFSIGRTLKDSIINGDISESSIHTIIGIEERSKFKSISKKDIFDVEYWSLEQAKLNKLENSLTGKVVLVTGGTGTIGYSTAQKFKDNGAEVIIIDKDHKKVALEEKKNEFEAFTCDVTSRKEFSNILSKISIIYGGIDILISNAGSAFQSPIAEIDDKDLRSSFDINFFSHQIAASESVKIMKLQQNGGCLLFNISKQAINPGKDFGSYGTSKAALLALCKQYALEYGQNGIRSNGVNADRILGGLLNKRLVTERAKARNTSVKNYLKGNLLKQTVEASDVADAFYNLAISKKTTAAVLTVDGGNIEASLR
jgi:rhamnose utilization protein RhaD (predicted bifunctional aldolase and dehydrogenase)/NAD(P)-dependent dehydrogenase (short-subunit alcohol dehydrogenase family)